MFKYINICEIDLIDLISGRNLYFKKSPKNYSLIKVVFLFNVFSCFLKSEGQSDRVLELSLFKYYSNFHTFRVLDLIKKNL